MELKDEFPLLSELCHFPSEPCGREKLQKKSGPEQSDMLDRSQVIENHRLKWYNCKCTGGRLHQARRGVGKPSYPYP